MPLDGTWYNELGSRMDLTVRGDAVTGSYTTEVSGGGAGPIGPFELAGRAHDDGAGATNIGFAVSWDNNQLHLESVTAWSGEYRVDGGVEIIKTTWLLTRETNQADDWKSTLVGQDVFTRTQPTARALAEAQRMKRRSHPA